MVNKDTTHRENKEPREAHPQAVAANAPRSTDRSGSQNLGASPSNTAPSNYQNTRILRSGIDSLYLSYSGNLRSKLEELLQAKKNAAQSQDTADQIEATVRITDQPFSVSGKGRGRFAYQLAHNWYHVQVSGREAGRLPLMYCQLRSEALTLAPLQDLLGSLGLLAEVLGGEVVAPLVSRVDLCTDFTTSEVLEHIPVSNWVRRCKGFSQYFQGDRYSGLMFGAGGQISCRLYDKTLELEKSGKDYMRELWKAAGWDGYSPVWRLEFQLRGHAINELQVRRLPDLRDNLTALWQYFTVGWLRLAVPDEGKNQTRWPDHPLWVALRNSKFSDESTMPLMRVRRDQSPDDERLFIHGLGGLTSYMAREGIDDLEEGIEAFYAAAHKYHRRISHRSGKTLPTYVREKTQLKRTKYNARQSSDYDTKTRGLK